MSEAMCADTLLAGFVVRISVRRHRWSIRLHDLKTGEVRLFDSFAALSAYLEQRALGHASKP